MMMKTFFEENKRPLLYAAGLHFVLLIVVGLNWRFLPKESGVNLDTPVVNAVMMEQATPSAKPEPIKAQTPSAAPPPQQKPIEQPKTTAVKPAPEKTATKTVDDPQAIPLVKPKVKPLPKKHDEDFLRQLDQEQKDLKQQKQQQKQKQLEQQLEQQLLKEDAPASKNASATTKTSTAAKSTPAAVSSALSSAEIDQYKAQIIAAISQQWIVPPNSTDKFCKFLIRLAPGGVVLDVKLIESSGNEALDRSARAAVFKASPLPVPNDNALFDAFRELNLTVHPKDSST